MQPRSEGPDQKVPAGVSLLGRCPPRREEAKMKRSPDIEKLIRDSLAAYERGDAAFIERMTSRQPGVVSIGTDANEYVLGHERILSLASAEMSSSPQMRMRIGEIRAYDHADVG